MLADVLKNVGNCWASQPKINQAHGIFGVRAFLGFKNTECVFTKNMQNPKTCQYWSMFEVKNQQNG